ncbi:hypothetical protein EJ06DRAFT_524784 [Trichodelitschia bisporula]|uniref:PHD-type domain-containing protein n=1 Tax=Trichodelitschia bisporula TaxID=703511 RepID=A0A6G1HKN9_9PEZI|nr:hypothetical protein EJ06DRAFT_524784 [Trichodelitschia bisporula]
MEHFFGFTPGIHLNWAWWQRLSNGIGRRGDPGPLIRLLHDISFPSSTPKSNAFHQPPFQTPKTESTSHFADAFFTPKATGQQTPADTPLYHSFTVVRRPASISKPAPLTPDDPKFHVNHFANTQTLPLPPVSPSRRLSSSPDPSKKKGPLSAVKAEADSSMDSFQMQTPPPTRDSSSRRDFSQEQAFSTPATAFHGPVSTPVQNGHTSAQSQAFQTPLQYPTLQFSPEVFNLQGQGPASAPPMQMPRLPWEESPQPNFGAGYVDASHNPFAQSSAMQNWQIHQAQLQAHESFQQQSAISLNQTSQATEYWTSGITTEQTSFMQNESFISTTGVNPNLIFSFSSPQHTVDPSSMRQSFTQTTVEAVNRQPYEHQTWESNRERELAKKARQQQNRSASVFMASQTLAKPALQRSNTDSGFRRIKSVSIDSRGHAQSSENIPRRPSPLKRNSQTSLTSIPESSIRPRPRTRLVIDETGRARTETVDQGSEVEIPRSFATWNDDDESEEDPVITSQRNSFAFQPDPPRRGKHARMDSDPNRFDVSKRPLSAASISSLSSRLGSASQRSSGDLGNSNFRRFSMSNFGGSLSAADSESPSKDSVTTDDDSGDAQAALRRVMEGRMKRQDNSDPQSILNAHNKRWSQASIDAAKLKIGYDPFNTNSSASPATINDSEVLTPTTDRSSRSTDSTRCVCNTTEGDGQLMIQCESCTKWLHVKCIGLNTQHLPPVYVCIFCTGNTPVARGGRIREPMRAAAPAYNSPLNYKSFRRQ